MDNKQWQLLKSDYVRRLRGYVTELVLFERNNEEKISHEQIHQIESLAHRLAGSGAAYGFPELSVKAKALELLIQGLNDDNSLHANPIIQIAVKILRESMEICVAVVEDVDHTSPLLTPADLAKPLADCPTVIVADDDPTIGIDLAATLIAEGFTVQVVTDIAKLSDAITQHNPVAVVCDIIFPEGKLAGVEYIKNFSFNRVPVLPVIFISSVQSFDARLACARAGGAHFFAKPLDKSALVRSLQELVGLKNNDPYRILIIDDDENLLQLYSETLESSGYKVFTALSARAGLDLLTSEDPEMILLDVHLPDCSGLELGSIIRQHERFLHTPIMFMSSDTRADVQMAAVRLAGDEFISKPIEPWRLLMTVEPRVKRSRMIRNPMASRHIGMINKGDAYDPLTALPNLRYLRKVVDENLASGNEKIQLCLLKIDIDDFHHVNDAYGHYQADRLLQQIAWEISHCLHFEDVLSRESGDEFYVLLVSPVSVSNQKIIIDSISLAISRVKISYNDNLHLTVSIGVALAPQDSQTAIDLIAHADTALFHAKESLENPVCYYDAYVQQNLLHQFKLENDVRHIFDKRQLLVFYQPIFSVGDLTLTGFEALARWRHPKRGIVCPDQFIYAVEKQGLMSRLTEWMLSAALWQLAQWQAKGHDCIMHINISASDVQNAQFVQSVENVLMQYNIAPNKLMFELTESTLMKNWDMGGQLLRKLRELGIKLAIDDFGTGYSSLSYLNRFPVDKLKIDRSFIHDWLIQKDERLISAIVSLSKAMGFGVVAEGVEEQVQLDFLKSLGCDEFQGYLFSKPLAAADVNNSEWFLVDK